MLDLQARPVASCSGGRPEQCFRTTKNLPRKFAEIRAGQNWRPSPTPEQCTPSQILVQVRIIHLPDVVYNKGRYKTPKSPFRYEILRFLLYLPEGRRGNEGLGRESEGDEKWKTQENCSILEAASLTAS
ncbi:hypothetical protein EVAR_14585_1 [Eumeta japonica]|uniref:Uncharacterized protein n=1 Tax=Eumeta variegata TaxID=151549 RepID=A0A4C1UUF4_EUMVA|nr:hypothetical protein EVAR_14585_1 [Eumeta japonica]